MRTDGIVVDDGFRLRGVQVTRLETFVDAAFAFSLTLLVIFQDSLPGSMEEVRMALRRIPTFVACFVLIALFWSAHNRWSRRFGLADTASSVLSLALVLAVLVYVYPLRIVVSHGLWLLTGGWVPSELGTLGADWLLDVQTIFIVYSAGFGVLSAILWRLNAHAAGRADALGLDVLERHELASETGMHRLMALTAAASIGLSCVVLAVRPDGGARWLVGAPMWAYAAMGIALPVYWSRRNRARPSLVGAERAASRGGEGLPARPGPGASS